jgi:hypothetical protein
MRHRAAGDGPLLVQEAVLTVIADLPAAAPHSAPPSSVVDAHAHHSREASAAKPAVVVPMGGVFADTEPIFLQVDGEAYKVYALRRLEIRFKARARLVSFL